MEAWEDGKKGVVQRQGAHMNHGAWLLNVNQRTSNIGIIWNKRRVSGVTPDLLNQNLHRTRVPQVIHGHSSLRNTGLVTWDVVVETQDSQFLCPHGVHGVAGKPILNSSVKAELRIE